MVVWDLKPNFARIRGSKRVNSRHACVDIAMAKKTRATTTTTTSTRDGLVDMGTVSAHLTVVRDDGDARRRRGDSRRNCR